MLNEWLCKAYFENVFCDGPTFETLKFRLSTTLITAVSGSLHRHVSVVMRQLHEPCTDIWCRNVFHTTLARVLRNVTSRLCFVSVLTLLNVLVTGLYHVELLVRRNSESAFACLIWVFLTQPVSFRHVSTVSNVSSCTFVVFSFFFILAQEIKSFFVVVTKFH